MKKIVIFFAVIIIIVCTIAYLYLNYKAEYNMAKKENIEFEKYTKEEITGGDLATIINKAIDINTKNEVQKDNKGIYINNNINSINIEIKIIDNDITYKMETIYNGGIQNFVNYYNHIKFKCTETEYHDATKKIKYLLFEQIEE